MRQVRLDWPSRPHAAPPIAPRILHPGLSIPASGLGRGSVRLLQGEALAVADRLLGEGLGGHFDLIHLDPPFGSDANYARARTLRVGDADLEVQLEAYGDDDGGDVAGYLDGLYPVLLRCHALLSERGSLYLHLDFRRGPYVRLLLDEIFGADNLVNEIVWAYGLGGSSRSRFQRKHDTVYFYARNAARQWFVAPQEEATSSMLRGKAKVATDIWRTASRDDEATIERAWPDSLLDKTLSNRDPERTGYPTQKPLALALRMMQASLPPGGLMLDLMSGSGTAGVAAALVGGRAVLGDRSLIALDCGRGRAVATGAAVTVDAVDAARVFQRLEGRAPATQAGGAVHLVDVQLPWPAGEQPELERQGRGHGADLLSAWGVGVQRSDGAFEVLAWWEGGAQRHRAKVPTELACAALPTQDRALHWLAVDVLGRGWFAALA